MRCMTWQYAFVRLMGRPRAMIRIAFWPSLSTLFALCGTVLFGLALVSILVVRLIDLDYVYNNNALLLSFPTAMKPEKREVASSGQHHGDDWNTVPNGIWKSKLSELFYGCSNPSKHFHRAEELHHNGYLMIVASGGLNQQRTGITDAVVVARLLNATLVLPDLDHHSYWKDSSNFSDIFDADWFVKALSPDVVVVKHLPLKMSKVITKKLVSLRVPRKCSTQYYQNRILPLLQKKQVLRLTKFDYRLSNNLDLDYQKLRCRVNYNALRFTEPISNMGTLLVKRLRSMNNQYIALHLRFEPDMLAFSGCYYGGGNKEVNELGAIRKRWKTLHVKNPEKERRHGKCPLTPEEVGLMLKAFGFSNDTVLYVASGEVYGGDASLAPLKHMFPNFFTKDTLASKEQLEPFIQYSSRMAAIDFIVCEQSDVFVTNNNGNMARILAGQRRYFGHKLTIRPNTKKLGPLFLSRSALGWEQFSAKVRASQIGFMGEPNEIKPGRGEFHENPAACICDKSHISKLELNDEKQVNQTASATDENRQIIWHDDNVYQVTDEQLETYKAVTDNESQEDPFHVDLPQGRAIDPLLENEDGEMEEFPWFAD